MQRLAQKTEREKWLLEEYKLLSQHYFHEDNFYQKTITIFLSLNTGLVAFINAFPEEVSSTEYKIVIPIIGVTSVFAWLLSINRSKAYKNKIEARIAEIETIVRQLYAGEELKLRLLHIRTERGKVPLLARVPSSFTNLILPFTFLMIWVLTILWHVNIGLL